MLEKEEVVESEICAVFTRAIGSNGVIKDIEEFKGGAELLTDYGVKVRIKVLENGDGTLISSIWFINESSSSGFEGEGHDAGRENERNEVREESSPVGVKAGKKIKSEAMIAGLGRSGGNVVMEGGKRDREEGFIGGKWIRVWIEKERPSCLYAMV
jgi:hypothetical protein